MSSRPRLIVCGVSLVSAVSGSAAARAVANGRSVGHLDIGVVGFHSERQATVTAVVRVYGVVTKTGIDVWQTLPNYDSVRIHLQGVKKWDACELPDEIFQRASRASLLEDLSPILRHQPDQGDPSTGVPIGYSGIVLAYRHSAYPKVPPTQWSDLWDYAQFPGWRALRDDPRGNLELALIADGVPVTRLYPLDVVRAFRKLSALAPHVLLWWTDDSQLIDHIERGGIAMAVASSPSASQARMVGEDIDFSWKYSVLELRWWAIPRVDTIGKSRSDFVRFVQDVSQQERERAVGQYVVPDDRSASPGNALSLRTMRQRNAAFVLNSQWWINNGQRVDSMWKAWRLKSRK